MSRPTTLPPAWAALAAAHGGVRALADALGISPPTLYRWARGITPISGSGAILLEQLKTPAEGQQARLNSVKASR